MASNIKLTIWKKGSNTTKDISGLVQKIVWAGKETSPARTLDVTILDVDEFNRSGITDLTDGWNCLFKWKGDELFRGIIMKTQLNSKGILTFKAYDVGIYLTLNKDAYNYKKKKADYIFKDVCKRCGLSVDKACSCSKSVEISKATTGWDVIQTALQEEFDSKGIRHAVTAKEGKLTLSKRRENVVKWLLESDNNIISWSYTDSIEKVKTRVKLYSSKNKTLATAKDKGLEKKIGIIQDVNKPDDKIKKKSKLKSLANSLLKELKKPSRTLQIQALGLVSMKTGKGAFVVIPEANFKKVFYIVSDSHTFQGDNNHTMNLTLKKATDLDY